MARPITPPEVLYERHADKSGGPDACWPYMGTRQRKDGYGKINHGRSGYTYAHIYAWQIANGRETVRGEEVRHSCNFPPCCNPKHLTIGSHAENMRDMVESDRSAKGENHSQVILSESDVSFIRTQLWNGATQKEVAESLGISRGTVHAVASGKNWFWFDGVKPLPPTKKVDHFGPKLTAKDVWEIRYKYGDQPSRWIEEKYGVSQSHVSCIRTNKTWRKVSANSFRDLDSEL